ncbi:DUF2867 domain-containing protein [Actinokineospora sp. NBRC 105648]|uniref:DUF2867 domain-containing protein n=1 Tax=Actinokineospora sp. NBRC 105648 TaxID=3032206 RepID=UPI0024A1E17C|nr:DUF2867 domain-containing protein [Actinokineospora sp. NBRC 105648]GLZ38852.1 NAD-dependent dehydratase [Actinokineospora sp. NBRC 105648]
MPNCLVIGARGYIGTRLVDALVEAGHEVRVLVRAADGVRPGVDIVEADAGDPTALATAMSEVDTAYHLVHSMSGPDFVSTDDRIAHAVATAAADAHIRQLVYLGGPRPHDDDVSDHLASRASVGDIFLNAPTPALVLQASMVIGAGSASFELLNRAARSAPFVLRPAYLDNRSRPIAVRDVLHYLVDAAKGAPVNAVADIAGPDTMTYLQLIQRCARLSGLPWRLPIPVAVLPAGPAALAASALSPLSAPLVRALLDSLRHDLVPDAVLPPPPGGATSVDRALREALGIPDPQGPPTTGLLRDHKATTVRATTDALWREITNIGGPHGWHTIPGVWTLRGALDHALGGVGLHKGRPDHLNAGDVVDTWSVVKRDDTDHVLLLRADMRLPGTAWLELRAVPGDRPEECRYEQTVLFEPSGLAGKLYWYAQKPAHDIVFALMLQGTARAAENL